ncbi:hypothetical protein [Streptomyces sp. NBC_01615]|uniref:hypothetical protein n=1 Tax=Streptomyces sp. NBC_01615 TaxID=2975898 RepID=UPI003869A934
MKNDNEFVAISFSPAADLAVDEAVEEFKNNLRAKAALAAASEGSATSNARHVADATARLMDELADPKGMKQETAFYRKFLWVASAVYAVIGAVVVTMKSGGKPLGWDEFPFFLGGFLCGPLLGMVLLSAQGPVMRLVMWTQRKNRQAEVRPSFGALIMAVTQLEISIRSRMSEAFGDSRADRSLGDLINRFSRAASLSDEDQDTLRKVLNVRNNVAHGNYSAVTADELSQATRDAVRLSSEFSSIPLHKA